MRLWMAAILTALVLLTGCASLLERTYSTSEPHSSKFWESEAANTLRAENYQDIVNDLLLLIGQHTETATLRLYNFTDDLTVADTLEQATLEVQQETPMGAYAVEYITSSSQAQRGYYDVALKIEYRRSLEQVRSIVNATSTEALSSLLEEALSAGQKELAVRIGYWDENSQESVESTVARLREKWEISQEQTWTVNYYPNPQEAGLVEFLLDSAEQEVLPSQEGEDTLEPDAEGEILG